MKRAFIFLMLLWFITIVIAISWNVINTRRQHAQFVQSTARAMFQHIVLTRSWNARHGGVYVPITETNKPNPYLSAKNREIPVNESLTLTKVNPAYMTRQIGEIAEQHDGIKFHITSLKPIRPENKASVLERTALHLFEQGAKEFNRFIKDGDNHFYFYMAPLTTTKVCLKCHAKQGYNLNDIRGGISISLPDAQPANILSIIVGHIVIGIIGSLFIIILMRRLTTAYDRVRQESTMDALTGVANRRYFAEYFLRETDRARRENTSLSLLLCDIDHFKKYNDYYGHLEGDRCLTRIAHCIEAELHRASDFCARYGGEEFVIVLPNTSSKGGIHVAEDIRAAVESLSIPHAASPVCDNVTLSIGVATSLDGNESNDELIKRADDALYRAKEQGRNNVTRETESATD